jgi:GNAT superfamily N-acetyltransferase
MSSPIEPWVRFSWNLDLLPAMEPELPKSFSVRPAEEDEHDEVLGTVSRAFILDPEWTNTLKNLKTELMQSLDGALQISQSPALVMTHGTRIVGVSVLRSGMEVKNHLVSGPCVLLEYRSRGLGKLLLEYSLRTLRETGLKTAYGLTKQRSTAARHVYPSFGGEAIPWEGESLFDRVPDMGGREQPRR